MPSLFDLFKDRSDHDRWALYWDSLTEQGCTPQEAAEMVIFAILDYPAWPMSWAEYFHNTLMSERTRSKVHDMVDGLSPPLSNSVWDDEKDFYNG